LSYFGVGLMAFGREANEPGLNKPESLLNHTFHNKLDGLPQAPRKKITIGRVMKPEDLKEMANRCRSMADGADDFIKRRLLDLALKYEARYDGRSLASRKLTSISATSHPGGGDPGQSTGADVIPPQT
jgi:hypothetical protein